MSLLGESEPRAPMDEWEHLWMPANPFRLRDGLLLDLSVDVETERELWRSRWSALVQVGLPKWVAAEDENGLFNFVDSHLRGRNPMTGFHRGALLITFAVSGPGQPNRNMVVAFANSFARSEVFGPAAVNSSAIDIFRTKSDDIEHLLPEERQSRS